MSDPTAHGGPLLTGAAQVLVNGMPAVRVGDHHGCAKHGPGPVAMGAPMVWIGGRPMARMGDLCLCIGSGGGTDEKGPNEDESDQSGVTVDADRLEVKAKGKYRRGTKVQEGKWKAGIDVAGGEIEGGIGPGGISGKGEGYVVKGNAGYGDEDNNVGLEVKGAAVEAEGESWVGQHDGKYGAGFKEKRGADGASAKLHAKSKGEVGGITLEESSYAEVGVGVDGEPPMGMWAWWDPKKGEVCIGGYGEVDLGFVQIEFGKEYKVGYAPGGAGAGSGAGSIPNLIAGGSSDVLLGG